MLIRLLLVTIIPLVVGTQQTQLRDVRGVPLSELSLFQPTGDKLNLFTCRDGAQTIPYSKLNDDYCDCLDGSDEPGTSSCQNTKFFCRNEGFTGRYVPSTRINDGICDCCDGSDEYDGGVSCANICGELSKAEKMERERVEGIARRGYAKRKELSREWFELRDEKLRNVDTLKQKKVDLELKLKMLENSKKIAEEISLDELKTLIQLDANNDAEVSDDEAKTYLPINEADYEYFRSNIYDRLSLAKQNQHDEEEKMPPYPLEIQAAIDAAVEARRNFDELNDQIQDIDNNIREADEFAATVDGEDAAWAAIKGKCFERNEWVTVGSNKHAKQIYTDGQQCWNGPQRSTVVVMECGEDYELADVTEPAKCEYHFVFRTPLACNDPDSEPKHEEL
ncbi:unnamed protein product [Caenorhabditis bovis]|uniref:Glucosidase 2 subunit beta n=1 Tax=Caenorhabditis bovis TaxID=2654633 RepID=A0A8S1F831_9PELO|nr:unnamed protein product [Caenorhabditis bovis]